MLPIVEAREMEAMGGVVDICFGEGSRVTRAVRDETAPVAIMVIVCLNNKVGSWIERVIYITEVVLGNE